MANEATLESLRIEVNASAQNASEGITSLVSSLRPLQTAVSSALAPLKELRDALKDIAKLKDIKLPSFGGGTSSSKPRGAIMKEFQKDIQKGLAWQPWRYGPRPLPTITNNLGSNTSMSEAELRARNPMWYMSTEEKIALRQQWEASHPKPAATPQIIAPAQTQQIKATTTALKETAQETRNVGKEAENASPKVSMFGKTLSMIGRMAKTMLIRTALRALMKAFSESWEAAYAFSHKMGGSFAKSVDAVRGAFASVSLTAIQTFAPILQALVPIVTVVANAINYLCSAIQSLLSLLGMTSDLLGASTKQMDKFRKSSGSGGGGTKGQLAKFDELNVIQSSASGGGSGGGGSGLSVFEQVSSEISAITRLLVGEGLIAVGLIMACTGHIPLGVAMMAVGAASIYGVVMDWGKLPADVQKTITDIGFTTGKILFGAGLILACAGHPVIGVGMMVAGAAAIAGTVALNWNNMSSTVKKKIAEIGILTSIGMLAAGLIITFACPSHMAIGIGLMLAGITGIAAIALGWNKIPKEVKKTIFEITAVAGLAIFEIGLVLALASPAHVGLGIAMMVAGMSMTAIALNWAGVPKNISGVLKDILFIAGIFSLAVGLVIALSGANIPLGIGLMAAGAVSIGSAISLGWSGLTSQLSKTLAGIMLIAGIFSLAVGLILALSGANIPLGIGLIVAGGVAIGSAIALDWGDLKEKTKQIMTDIADWFKEKWNIITNAINDAKNALQDFINKLIGIKNPSSLKTGTSLLPTASIASAVAGVASAVTNPGQSPFIVKEPKKIMNTIFSSVLGFAEGGYGIPSGDLFLANERGAEYVGSMNGKTTVANQEQIIEGIQRGVSDANAEQNTLLRRQNELLQQILEKETSVRFGASSALGRIVTQSQQMYAKQVGG